MGKPVLKQLVCAMSLILCFGAAAGSTVKQNFKFEMRQTNYLTPAQQENAFNQYADFLGRYHFVMQGDQGTLEFNGGGVYSVSHSQDNHLVIPEAYAGYKLQNDPTWLYVGRKKFSWSQIDERWELGLWQPFFRWDYLRPEAQGLTGAFIEHSNNRVQFRAFGSVLYLPEQIPQFQIDDGNLSSASRWYTPPVRRARIGESTSDIHYVMDEVSLGDIVDQVSYGASARLGRASGAWLQAAYAHKPMSRIQVALEGDYYSGLDHELTGKIPVKLHPLVVHHQLISAEGGWRGAGLSLWLSYNEESPVDVDTPKEWRVNPITDTKLYSAGMSHSLGWLGWHNTWMRWSYLKIDELSSESSQDAIKDSTLAYLRRYPYQQAVGWELSAPVWKSRDRILKTNLRYEYALDDMFARFSAEVKYQPAERWQWWLGVDVLGVEMHDADDTKGYMAQYPANDRVQGGLTYVF